MRQFMQPVRNCTECQHKSYSAGIEGHVCSKNDRSVDYSLKAGRNLFKQNIYQITPSCPMYESSVEVNGEL